MSRVPRIQDQRRRPTSRHRSASGSSRNPMT